MEMTTREQMQADPDVIYALAANVRDWPVILPHYRWVRILRERGPRRLVEMAAHRDGFPVRWTAVQELHPDDRRITFRHVKGVTRGMEVAWRLSPRGASVDVEIWHAFTPGWPLIPDGLVRFAIGDLFIENIAEKTLRRIKELAEAQAGASAARQLPHLVASAR